MKKKSFFYIHFGIICVFVGQRLNFHLVRTGLIYRVRCLISFRLFWFLSSLPVSQSLRDYFVSRASMRFHFPFSTYEVFSLFQVLINQNLLYVSNLSRFRDELYFQFFELLIRVLMKLRIAGRQRLIHQKLLILLDSTVALSPLDQKQSGLRFIDFPFTKLYKPT